MTALLLDRLRAAGIDALEVVPASGGLAATAGLARLAVIAMFDNDWGAAEIVSDTLAPFRHSH